MSKVKNIQLNRESNKIEKKIIGTLTTKKNFFNIIKLIKKNNGKIYEAEDEHNNKVIIKAIPEKYETSYQDDELCITQKCQNELVVELIENEIKNGVIYMIMKKYECTLSDLLRNNYDYNIKKYMLKEIADSLKIIHDKGYVHGDIGPNNFLVDHKNKIVISDFGSSKLENEKNLFPNMCTLNFASPESILRDEKITKKSDIWSLGCLFYLILREKSLIKGTSEKDALISILNIVEKPIECPVKKFNELHPYSKIQKFQYEYESNKYYTNLNSDCEDLIRNMLKYNPDERLTIDEVINHKLFK